MCPPTKHVAKTYMWLAGVPYGAVRHSSSGQAGLRIPRSGPCRREESSVLFTVGGTLDANSVPVICTEHGISNTVMLYSIHKCMDQIIRRGLPFVKPSVDCLTIVSCSKFSGLLDVLQTKGKK